MLTLPLFAPFALVAAVVSFSSPWGLPLVPSYLSYVSALPVTGLDSEASRRVTTRAALLFVAGFTFVFTAFGIGVTLLGSVFLRNQDTIVRFFGVLIIVMGLATLGVLHVPFLYRERRIDLGRLPRGPGGAFAVGMAFAAGWAPCIGPVLATILATAATSATVLWGGVLLAIYSVGLGIPFVLLALGVSRMQRSATWLRTHGSAVERVGGGMLVVVGILFITGGWLELFRPLQRWFAEMGWPPI